MRKYLVCPHWFFVSIFVAVVNLFFLILLIAYTSIWSLLILLFFVCCYFFFWNSYLAEDYTLGRFSFDKQGITFFAPGRSMHFDWDDVAEIGLADGIVPRTRYNFAVYCSKVTVPSPELRKNLALCRETPRLRKKTTAGLARRKGLPDYPSIQEQLPTYLTEYVLFHYRKRLSASFAECLPERLREPFLAADEFAKTHPRGGIL